MESEFGESRSVVGIHIATSEGRRKLATKTVILACGGLETTRLLLVAQRTQPHLFGGLNGPLGRYYMGHISGKMASLALARRSDAEYFDFFREPGRSFVRRRITFEKRTLIKHGIQNVSFWLDNPPFYDADHRSGILSLVYLALLIPPIGRRILSEGVRIMHIGQPPYRYVAHARNVVGSPLGTASSALQILYDRYSPALRKPGFLIRNSAGRYALHYHGEQRPNAESRVTLSNSFDALGVPRLKIDLRYSRDDVVSIIAAHSHLADALRQSGKGRLDFWDAPQDRARRVEDQASDGFHQIGTTRMSTLPEEGVTNGDCRVHGVDNLYVASSSVFPTSGQANPTFATVALALRLARHLCR
nr:GMC family oxidoreductase [uncultured Rhodopila sp.]